MKNKKKITTQVLEVDSLKATHVEEIEWEMVQSASIFICTKNPVAFTSRFHLSLTSPSYNDGEYQFLNN